VSDGPEPTPERLSKHAIPATYRRAPRTERFILSGASIGAFVGVVLGVILPAGTSIGRGSAAVMLGLAGALAGGLITGAQAAYIEYTSGRSADRQRAQLLSDADAGATTDADAAVTTDTDAAATTDADPASPYQPGDNNDDGTPDGAR